jgi:RNA polymerase sigma factor (sigma-70 family)
MVEESVRTTVRIERCLARLGTQDPGVRAELLEYARRRLVLLADRMYSRFPLLHRHEEADDVFQDAMLRLWQSLEEVGPTTVAGFMGLAALQMRRALVDLCRHHFGRRDGAIGLENTRPNVAANNGHTFENQPADRAWAPHDLACWSEFHLAADRLPEPERTVFDLLYYHELPQSEVAGVLQMSERQVRRHWQAARRELHCVLEDIPL